MWNYKKQPEMLFLASGLISIKHGFEKEKTENVINVIEYMYSKGLFDEK